MKRIFSNLITLIALSAILFAAVAPAAAAPRFDLTVPNESGIYIVEMAAAPVVVNTGDAAGMKGTQPLEGEKVDPLNADVMSYVAYINNSHDAALKAIGGGQKLYDYSYTFNGFAAELTAVQAAKLASLPGVLAVTPDELVTMDTSSTPTFLELDAHNGLWKQLGGVDNAGEGVIIGVIDTGIWPESESFSDLSRPHGHSKHGEHHDYHIPGWHGKCVSGQDFSKSLCNNKLIGARWFNAAWGGDAGIAVDLPWEYNSARDYNGHGTHTASTAAGNNGVQATGPAAALGKISGMAPRANIAVYKALWDQGDGTASGWNSDLVAAIDQAVADGVDVINYSVSGSLTNFRDPVEIAFLYAAEAGVFVAASAGNSGPTTSTVAHPSPWITTVAAGTHNRSFEGGSVTLGNGVTYTGVGYLLTTGSLALIDATAAGLAGADPATLALCYGATDDGTARLDPAMVSGKIVVCNRGSNVLVNKAQAVKDAGGAGMVLVNTPTSSNTLPFVAYTIPAVHLPVANYDAVKAYAAAAGATATINAANIIYTTPAPYTASFSSRGPLRASGDLLKPDLIAPGQDILAAVAPPGNDGLDFNLYSGTSMSSPHVAGLAALLKQLHPRWTPMMIKSALMTTAYDVLDGPNTNPLVIFRQGAGHVKPNSAADPGLVFDSRYKDWMGFLCGTQLPTSFCTSSHPSIPVLDPSDFNAPSIAIAQLAGSQTVTRTVTNVGDEKSTYNVSVTGLTGLMVNVSPATFTLHPGHRQKLQITITQSSAVLNAYTGGYLTWADGKHSVRIPVVVKPVALAAPLEVSGNYNVTFGYTGAFTAAARGLVEAQTFTGSVITDDYFLQDVTIPAGTTYARFSLFDANVSPASDLDLRVFDSAFNLIGSSGGGTSQEEVNFLNPAADTYYVVVDGYATGNPSTFTLFAWVLGTTDAGNMTVSAPASATLGTIGAINLSFGGLTSGSKYLGSVAYGGIAGLPNPTIVRYDAP